MKIITKNIVSEGTDGWAEYALITLIDRTKQEILQAKELFQMVKSKDGSLYSLEFWDASAEHFACHEEDTFTEEQLKEFEDKGFIRMNPDTELSSLDFVEESRTECDILVVQDDGFFWRGSHKYTSDWVETKKLPFELLIDTP